VSDGPEKKRRLRLPSRPRVNVRVVAGAAGAVAAAAVGLAGIALGRRKRK
jgi:hypothetical protein